MSFEEILDQAIDMLRRRRRLTYRTLKRQFELDDDALEDLAEELIYGQRVAADEDGRVLVWNSDIAGVSESELSPSPSVSSSQIHEARPLQSETSSAVRMPGAERRQITVMFCDLVDSTPLSQQLDPEDLREIVRDYQQTCEAVIRRFEGHIAQLLGDALLVYFGWPQAHEDDAQRAVQTGLEMLDAMHALNRRLQQANGIRLAIRVGIHTGLVVVGEMGGGNHQEQLALGDTPNIASRLQGLAEPDTMLISDVTFRLIEGYFTCRLLGTPPLKGVATPLQVYQVVGESRASTRFEMVAARGLTPLVGREEEIGLMLRRWEQAKRGEGQVLLLSGEAGIGKSRSVQAVCEHIANEPHILMRLQCSPYHTNTAFYPITEQFAHTAGFTRRDSAEQKLDKLETHLSELGLDVSEVAPLFAAALSIPTDNRYAPLDTSPQQQKERTIAALADRLLATARQQPLLFIAEDLHWGDPTSLESIGKIIEMIQNARVFILCTHRPEFVAPWGVHGFITTLSLNRLSQSQRVAMATELTAGKSLPAEVLDQILAKSDGIPLFVEEITKSLLESEWLAEKCDHYELVAPLPPMAIPSTLQDALMARLDRLDTLKEVAQIGATIGREFSYELLCAVAPFDEAMLQEGLRQLVNAELCFQRGTLPQTTYLFKHALVQDAAYQSLLRNSKQRYHQRIADVLESQFAKTAEQQPELLAHHYTAAGLPKQAIAYWQQAGQRAIERSANLEAEAHLTQGLEMIATLPDTLERAQQELAMQTTLGLALVATRGFASPEVLQTYERAHELCRQAGETPQVFQVLRGLWYFYLIRSQLPTALELGEQLLSLAQQVNDSVLRVEAHYALGLTLNYLGEFAEAATHLAQGIALYNPQHHQVHILRYGLDTGVACRAYGAANLWWLGYPEQAMQQSHEAVALARQLAHPFSLGFALFLTSWVPHFRREGQRTYERADAAVTLAAEHGFAVFGAGGTIFRGWAMVARSTEPRAKQADMEAGIDQIRQGMDAWRATGGEALRPYYLALLAEACGKQGQVEEGLQLLDEALSVAKETGECRWDAELHRLTGELLLMHSGAGPTSAETCFRQALDIARRQQAKALELRAGMSLGRLWQRQGKHAQAQRLLAPIYGWFSEGFDTADLQEANALLIALGKDDP